jgi:hypothetical protein
MITIKYKGEDFKFDNINIIIILSDITFSIVIFIWYLLYTFKIFTYFSPFFALILTLFQNIIIIFFLIYKKQLNIADLFKYIIILIILKVIPILSFYPNKFIIHFRDVFFILYLYAFYIIILIILDYIFDFNYDLKKTIMSDLHGDNYNKTPQYKIFDLTYDGIISVLFSNNNSFSK